MATQSTSLVKYEPAEELQPSPSSGFPDGAALDLTHAQKFQWITPSAMKQGVHIQGASGAGKSRLMARVFAMMGLRRREPQILIDPRGTLTDNLLDKIIRQPLKVQAQLFQDIFYMDAGSTEFVVPTRLYYRLKKSEKLFETANRFPSVLKRLDEQLQSAPIMGWNSLYECAIYAGQIAVALDRQIDFVADLVAHPAHYKEELRQAVDQYPELQPAVTYFRELMDPKASSVRERRLGSFTNKLLPFLADPTMLATFTASKPGFTFEKAIRHRKTVLIDLRNEQDPDRRRFKMVWYMKCFTDYIKHRGMAGRGEEVWFYIDEITQLLGPRTMQGNSILAEDLEELISVLARNLGVNVLISNQNLSQCDERIQNVLMSMGNQLIGIASNPDDALRIARQFVLYKPYWIKKQERVWMSIEQLPIMEHFGGSARARPTIIDYHDIEFRQEEQILMAADQIRTLKGGTFLSQIAVREGEQTGPVKKISIANLDRGEYPIEKLLAPLRQRLAQRDGVPVTAILAEIEARRTALLLPQPAKPNTRKPKSASMKESSPKSNGTSPSLPVATNPVEPVLSDAKPEPTPKEFKDEDLFQ
jgi:hypothetical protein